MKPFHSFITILLLLLASWTVGLAQPVSFTEQTVGSASNSFNVGHADLNNDGHIDLVSAEAVSGKLYWWKNDGLANPSFTRIQFEGNFAQSNNFVLADLNGDGTIDIINSSFTLGEVAAWFNNGEPDTPTFTKKVIKSGFASALGVAVGDLDNDGDIDIAASAQFSGAKKVIVRWNDGNPDPAFSETTLGNLTSINRRGLVVVDYNKDGKQDVIAANDGANQVKFFRNLGGQAFQERTILSTQSLNYHAAFMNDDNDHLDVLVLNQGFPATIQYYRNLGNYNPPNTQPNFSIQTVGGSVGTGSEIFPADLDNDGNMDVICASVLGPKALQWYENGGGANPNFTSYTINAAPGYFGSYNYQAADLDGDDDLDIYGGELSKVVWYENDLLEPCEISITCKDPFNFPVTINGGTSVISGQDMVKDHLTEDCNSNLTYTINGQNLLDFFCVDIGPQTLNIVATDEDGNSASCSIDIQVVDLIAPSITCPDDQDVDLDSNCEFEIPDYTGLASVVDNCSNTIIQTPSEGTIVDENRTMILTVVDQEGQTSTCIFSLNVEDNDGPTAVCLDNTINFDNPINLGLNETYALQDVDVLDFNQTSDNCTNFNVTGISPSTLDCDDVGTTVAVTVTVGDDNGNTSICTANISVEDNEGPQLICRNQTINLGFPPYFSSVITFSASDVTSVAVGSCGNIFVGAVPASISCEDVGSTVEVLVTWRDVNFNESTCTAFITVEDGESPYVLCNDPTVQLDENGKYSLVEADVFAGGSDNCGTVNFKSMSPSDFDCDDAGSTIAVTVTANDGNGNTSTCTAQVTVEDNEDPTVLCNNPTVEVDASGSYTLTEADVFAGGSDNCGTVTYIEVSPSKVNCSDVGNTVQVTVTGEDSNGNTSTCTVNVMVKDNIQPVATCNSTSVQLDANGQYTLTQADVYSSGTDNCGTVNFESMNPTMVDCDDAETTVSVTVTINDGNGNTNTCIASIMVDDNTPPVPVCTNTTITFNGEDDIAVSIDDLYDTASSSDNCGTINLVSPTMDQVIDCDQIGDVIPVVIMVNDGNGNDANCTANITVEGLPCGFANTFGIGDCYDPNGNAADYDPNTGIFTLTSDGCAPAFPYIQDDQSYIQYELCGDGVIDVYIEDLDGSGYTGIVMRESAGAGARKVAISTNTINKLLKEVRVSPNYPAYPQQVFSLDKYWLRIERINGFFFKASASVDGITYIPIINQAVQMTGCVQTGLFVYSSVDGESVTAQFSNVTISEANQNLANTENFQTESTNNNASLEIGLSPNPAKDVVNINLNSIIGEEVNIRVYDINGQLMTQVHYDEVENATEVIALDRFPSGTYYVNVRSAQQQQTLKLIKQ